MPLIDDPRLAGLPRYGYSNRDAWRRLRLARPFVLRARDGTPYHVDRGGWARDISGAAPGPPVHASKLLDQGKKSTRRS